MKKNLQILLSTLLGVMMIFVSACSIDKMPKSLEKFLANDFKNVTINVSGKMENTFEEGAREAYSEEIAVLILTNSGKYYEELTSGENYWLGSYKNFYAKIKEESYEYWEEEGVWKRRKDGADYEKVFENMKESNGLAMLYALSATDFEAEDDWYYLKQSAYKKIEEWVTAGTMEYFKIKIAEEKVVVEFSTSSTYPDINGEMVTHSTYLSFTFSDFGKTKVVLPKEFTDLDAR